MPACGTLDGEALAAAGTACIDDSAASTRLHADTETVGALAAGNGRLEGAFHGRNLKRAAAGLKANTHGNRQSGKWNSEKPTISAKNALGVNGLVAFRLGAVVRVMRCPAADACCGREFALSPGLRRARRTDRREAVAHLLSLYAFFRCGGVGWPWRRAEFFALARPRIGKINDRSMIYERGRNLAPKAGMALDCTVKNTGGKPYPKENHCPIHIILWITSP